MKKIILSSVLAIAGLSGSLSAGAIGLDPTQVATGSIELTCNHAANSTAMIVTSGGYSVVSNGAVVANQGLKDILVANTAWLSSFSPAITYDPTKAISKANIPCTAAVAELGKYALAAYLANYIVFINNIGSGGFAVLPPAIADYSPKLSSNEKGDVTYHWSFFLLSLTPPA